MTHALPVVVQIVGEVMEGASKPVGGDDEAVFHLDDESKTEQAAVEMAVELERGNHVRSPHTAQPAH